MMGDLFAIKAIAPGYSELKKSTGDEVGRTILIYVPNGDMAQAAVGPYSRWDLLGITADEVLTLLRHPLETIN